MVYEGLKDRGCGPLGLKLLLYTNMMVGPNILNDQLRMDSVRRKLAPRGCLRHCQQKDSFRLGSSSRADGEAVMD